MKKSSSIALALTLAVAVAVGSESCSDRESGSAWGRNNRGDSVMRRDGRDYYYRGGGWMMVPNGYYGGSYRNGYSSAHGGYGNSSFRSSYSSNVSRGGFGSTGRGGSSAS